MQITLSPTPIIATLLFIQSTLVIADTLGLLFSVRNSKSPIAGCLSKKVLLTYLNYIYDKLIKVGKTAKKLLGKDGGGLIIEMKMQSLFYSY